MYQGNYFKSPTLPDCLIINPGIVERLYLVSLNNSTTIPGGSNFVC
jgi:hypothetical protein